MTIQGQLAQSAQAQERPIWQFAMIPSAPNADLMLLANTSIQTRVPPSDVDAVIEMHVTLFSGMHSPVKLGILKRQRFKEAGRHARIETSLKALNSPQPIELTLAEWKAIVEEIEDED